LLTGRYPWRIGQFGVLSTFSPPIIEASRPTVGSLLQQYGYHTACFGKWHLGMVWRDRQQVRAKEKQGQNRPLLPVGAVADNGPTTRGFNVFSGYTHAMATNHDDGIGRLIAQDRVASYHEPVEIQPLLAKQAVAYIDDRAKAGGPFFLYVPLSIPHNPIVPAPEFLGKSGAKAYGDWLFQGDWVTGQIMEALERNGLAQDTLLIVTSDNGAAGREYPPLRGSKFSIYEGGHRVPFLVRWPGKIKPGSACNDTICLNDLMATCAEILEVKLPDGAGEDSVSILPDLLGTAQGPVREATVHQSHLGDLAIRQGPWKLIFLEKGGHELYDLAADLSETRDVVAAHPDVVARLKNLMGKYVANGRSTPGAVQKNGTDVEQVRALHQNLDGP
jgi:arylsulfatase A-like enzyme